MRRRDILSLLGGAAVSWPLGARAQQTAVPVVGFLHGAVPDAYTPMTVAFRKSLSEVGDVTIEYRWAEGRFERRQELARDEKKRRV
jgi:putative ABC transport system substrate-binding protein